MIKQSFLIGAVALAINTAILANGFEPTPMPEPPPPSVEFAPGIYVGLQLGYAFSGWENLNDAQYSFFSSNQKLATNNEDSFAGRAVLGYDISRNFAIEAGYLYLTNKARVDLITSGGLNGAVKLADITTSAIDLSGKMKLPLNDIFELYGKLGVAYMMSSGLQKADSSASKLFADDKLHTLCADYGLGINYYITPNLIADMSWTQYYGNPDLKMNSQNQFTAYQPSVNLFSLGIAYKFDI